MEKRNDIELLFSQAVDFHRRYGEKKKKALFLRGEWHPVSADLPKYGLELSYMQTYRPAFDELKNHGCVVSTELSGEYDLILFIPTRQRQESLGWFAKAIDHLQADGRILVCCPNSRGAKTYEKYFKKLFGRVHSISKSKCRCFWNLGLDHTDPSAKTGFLKNAERRPNSFGFITEPGVYGWDKVDKGSALLCSQLPDEMNGTVADVGSGYGYLARHIIENIRGVREIHLYESEHIALECSRANLESAAAERNIGLEFHWSDIFNERGNMAYDRVVCNPPFHSQSQTDYDLGKRFITEISKNLKKKGTLYLVANEFLPYENSLEESFSDTRQLIRKEGYKVIRAVK